MRTLDFTSCASAHTFTSASTDSLSSSVLAGAFAHKHDFNVPLSPHLSRDHQVRCLARRRT